ncbi:hypothetical protein [Xanthomonas sp. MUS 060]|uniref:hypothetical protein n=1 Tax=Xanthomonas sp. MUS 060 TaxID=1588031 RepID=UPI0005F2B710|nr:hypothetical protein [Xanthomonas sp. MUS 060]
MSQNGYSVGRDITVVIILPDGSTLNMGKVTSFKSKQDTTDTKIKGIDGIVDHLRFYEGWSGSFDSDRRGPELDQHFARLEANYFAGADEPPSAMQTTIVEPNGQVSQYRYERVLLKYDDAGDWSGDKPVHQKISFVASRRIQQA